ncbi:hypothetical protein ACPOL_6938 (plasmid) [Acidisarcina polymorpha]|uniref:Uncharacterized protein n=1 Tax=Acidisarcina polymorpha TaxID=2211140 RepID=A0A2Z5GA56_9BACT|nr:hypothetical protein [Acidisarcina polymorpha]AXC16142.1 hypothetical protein ACPOL_6938 [Acidisarcina polymorpha]
MGRRRSWLDRLYSIARTVQNSARSHYDRRDLEELFVLQPRSAQLLMAALPTVPVGRARLVEREALAELLGRLEASDDPARAFAEILKAGKPAPVRRKLRTFVRQDIAADLDSLPANLSLETGRLTVTFERVEELAEALVHLAVVLEIQLDDFAARYEPPVEPAPEELAARQAEQADLEYLRN